MSINLKNKAILIDSLDLIYHYSYDFTLNCEIDKNELAIYFPDDFIELMKEQFGEELKKIINNK